MGGIQWWQPVHCATMSTKISQQHYLSYCDGRGMIVFIVFILWISFGAILVYFRVSATDQTVSHCHSRRTFWHQSRPMYFSGCVLTIFFGVCDLSAASGSQQTK